MSPLHLIWLIPVLLFVGFQIGSIVEKVKKYNFADVEVDLFRGIYAKASAEEKLILGKLVQGIKKLEFWKR